MSEQTPYIFDLDGPRQEDNLDLFRENLVTTGQLEHKGEDYTYGVIKKELAKHIPRFVGMPGGNNLFASNEIPETDITHSLRHEIECNRLRMGEVGRCRKIEEELLSNLDPQIHAHLVRTRYETFKGLCAHYKIDPANPPTEDGLKKEIFGTFQFLLERLETLNEQQKP
jgi:hypothetical protein